MKRSCHPHRATASKAGSKTPNWRYRSIYALYERHRLQFAFDSQKYAVVRTQYVDSFLRHHMKTQRTSQPGPTSDSQNQSLAPSTAGASLGNSQSTAGASLSNSEQAENVDGTANSSVVSTIGGWLPESLQTAWYQTLGTQCESNLAESEAWYGEGVRGPIRHAPSTGLGGFDASWIPAPAGVATEKIAMNVKIVFHDAVTMSGTTASPTFPNFQSVADMINALPVADRLTLAAEYQWGRAGKTDWCTKLATVVDSGWSGKHSFFINKPQWDWIGADVDVDLTVAEGAQGANDHLGLQVFKVDVHESLSDYGSGAKVNGGSKVNAMDQTGLLASTALAARNDGILEPKPVRFSHDSASLDRTAQAQLAGVIRKFDGAPGSAASQAPDVKLTGFASAVGAADYNARLSQRRVDAVANYLRTNGFTNVNTRVTSSAEGEKAADVDPTWGPFDRRVDIELDGAADQTVAIHEFGHAFGLDDEYATEDRHGNPSGITGSGNPAGTQVDHDSLTQKMTDASNANLPGAIAENNDNIMSFGNNVLPQHYSTFWEALTKVTAVSEWSVGKRKSLPAVQQQCVVPQRGGGTP